MSAADSAESESASLLHEERVRGAYELVLRAELEIAWSKYESDRKPFDDEFLAKRKQLGDEYELAKQPAKLEFRRKRDAILAKIEEHTGKPADPRLRLETKRPKLDRVPSISPALLLPLLPPSSTVAASSAGPGDSAGAGGVTWLIYRDGWW